MTLEQENEELRRLLEFALYFSSVGVSRGPDNSEWLELMESAGKLGFETAQENFENWKRVD